MNVTLYIIVFLVFFIMALVGVYQSGRKNGKKEMLEELIDKKVISTDIYIKFLKVLNQYCYYRLAQRIKDKGYEK